ncbi:MAG TPA: polyprenyl synthetase family protein [Anaerolineae bacterium]|nr:polyprenyl synthetase family protein [Anaerolineae bacterium]
METTTTTFFDLVRADLEKVEARMRQGPGGHHPQLNDAIEHLLSSGGKRLRPILVLLTCGMLGADCDESITLAAAVEMLHTATLVHDDLIDGSLLRRGYPTLNAKLSLGATVLTGDYIFARAAYLASVIGSKALMRIFSRTLMTIVNGEISQLFGTQDDDPRQEYFDRIYAKTASLFEVSCEGAALLSGCDNEVVTTMKSFGYNVGIAFQIVDDILDFVSDQERVGKPVANDLRQGLITLPTLCYLESNLEDGSLREKLLHRELDDETIECLIEDIRTSGATDQALEQANQFISTAKKLLMDMPSNPEREGLYELADYVVQRTI